MVWREVLDLDSTVDLTDPTSISREADYLARPFRTRNAQTNTLIGSSLLQNLVELHSSTPKDVWSLWVRFVSCLRTEARSRSAARNVRAGMLKDDADWFFWWVCERFIGKPITLVSGYRMLPNKISPANAVLRDPTLEELKLLGGGRANIARNKYSAAVVKFGARLFGSLLASEPALCEECEAILPQTHLGERSRRAMCRRCENAAFYVRNAHRNREHLREQWRANKRRQRSKGQASTD
jgi:hypothetical protein